MLFFGRKDTFFILKEQVWKQFFSKYLLFNKIVAIFATDFYTFYKLSIILT